MPVGDVAYRGEMEDDAVGYVRASSDQQLDGGGVAAQEASIHAYCLQHGLRLLRIDCDLTRNDSDALDTRTGMAAALRSLEAGEASVLVLYDRTELSGDAVLLETTIQRLGQAGARVLSVIGPDSDANEHTNALIHRVLGAVDQYNRAVIRAKTEASQAQAVAEGRRGRGPSPYGYRSERGRLRQVPDEQEVLARIVQLRGAGASLRAICRELNDAGVTARAGGRWRPHDVSGALHTGALGDEAR
jgi:DNA invertase Pin-like site-specific DNA recombinase